jgi:hypothetical protein
VEEGFGGDEDLLVSVSPRHGSDRFLRSERQSKHELSRRLEKSDRGHALRFPEACHG